MQQVNHFQDQADKIATKLGLKDPIFVGKGAFKETYRVTDSSVNYLALKIFDPTKSNIQRSEREIEAMKMCDCEFVGKLRDYGEVAFDGKGKISFSLEDYFDGGTLSDSIQSAGLKPKQLRELGGSLCRALSHLKALKLVHRDIKPDNIMYRKGSPNPILVDFGLVRNLSQTSLTDSWMLNGPGTPYFSSPEQLNNDKALIGWRSDQFCLGVVLAYSTFKYHPFEDHGMTTPQVVERVARRGSLPNRFLEDVKKSNLFPLLRMLELWPVRRHPDPEQLVIELERMG